MRPLESLREECENVRRALEETLRHDYGPELSAEFYGECADRLEKIDKQVRDGSIAETDRFQIAALLAQLNYLARLIALIERSRLGEFSWPFAHELRLLAKQILVEPEILHGESEPIVHVVSDAVGYRIHTEDALETPFSRRIFTIVLFPRQSKDNVLLHAIFGHELGHAALGTMQTGPAILSQVLPALGSKILATEKSIGEWLRSSDAPDALKAAIAEYEATEREPFVVTEAQRELWLTEFTCDLYGLLLFGPAFLAAHRNIIEPTHQNPFRVDSSHPPYAARHKMLLQAMKILQWQKTISLAADDDFHLAEVQALAELTDDPFPKWASIFSEEEVDDAIKGIKSCLGTLGYVQPTRTNLVALLRRLKMSLPPILDGLTEDGNATLGETDFRQILHAGWLFWGGREKLEPPSFLSFLQTNQLCNQALLQQRAISEFLET
jgi:hypothetical protein